MIGIGFARDNLSLGSDTFCGAVPLLPARFGAVELDKR